MNDYEQNNPFSTENGGNPVEPQVPETPQQPDYSQPSYTQQPNYTAQPDYSQPSYTTPQQPNYSQPTAYTQPQQPQQPSYVPPQQPPYQPQQPNSVYSPYGPINPIEPKEPGSGMAIASLILGISGIVTAIFCCCVPYIALICSILAVVFGILGLKAPSKRTMSIVGICLGGLAFVIGIILLLMLWSGALNEILSEFFYEFGYYDWEDFFYYYY